MTTLAALQDQLNAIQAQIDGMKACGERVWPQQGDVYFDLDADGRVSQHVYDTPQIDDPCVLQGNAFRTESEATRERDRRALIAELRRHPKACAKGAGKVWCLAFNLADWEWFWDWNHRDDSCPSSGYFFEQVPGLIEQYGSRLDLLRSA